MKKNHAILLVEDDVTIAELLIQYFNKHEFDVSHLDSGEHVMNHLAETLYDMVLLDIMLPHTDGLTLLPKIRSQCPTLPIIMITARGDDVDRILGLEMGADDYMAKPFNPRELLARVNAVLRRHQMLLAKSQNHTSLNQANDDMLAKEAHASQSQSGKVMIDHHRMQVFINHQLLTLTSVEFLLLKTFIDQPGEVISREYLSETILERKYMPYDKALDVHVCHLRKKLQQFSPDQSWIKSIRGKGYQYVGE